MEDFKDWETAQSWDADPVARNPVRPEQLDILLSILEGEYAEGKAILDIGMGSGIVEELILRRIAHAYVVGVDASEAMLEIANHRLREFGGRYEVVVHDFTQIDTLKLPEREYQAAISVQAIHNVADEYKLPIFRFVHQTLEPGGIFLLLDRIAVDTPGLFSAYRSVWQRLNRVHGASMREGDTFEEHTRKVAARGDLPASLERHLVWLREAGFEAACLHLHANRALFAARKPYV
jgi:tRNA (cmo5U34)-methyltransferase